MDVNDLLRQLGGSIRHCVSQDPIQPVWLDLVYLDGRNTDAGGNIWLPAAPDQRLYCIWNDARSVFWCLWAFSADDAKLRFLQKFPRVEFM